MKQQITNTIDEAIANSKTITEFFTFLETKQISLEPHLQGEHISGLVYEYQGVRISGSSLGRGYTWLAVTKKIHYDPARDFEAIRQRVKNRQLLSMSAEPVPMSPRQRRDQKRRLLDKEYADGIKNLFADESSRIDVRDDSYTIHLEDGGKITDYGDRITAENMAHDNAVERIIRLALHKDWEQVTFFGEEAFVYKAMMQAILAGLNVMPRDDAQRALLDKVRAGLDASMQDVPLMMERFIEPEAPQPLPLPAPIAPVSPPIAGRLGSYREQNAPAEELDRKFKPK